MRRRNGMTLVEILVVIGVIGVLVAILLPALSGMRKKARENGCRSNLRQLFQSTMLFTQESNGRLPRPARIGETITHYNYPEYGDFSFVMNTNVAAGGAPNGVVDLKVGRLWKFIDDEESRKGVIYCPNDRGERPHISGTFVAHANPRNFSYSWNYNIRPNESDGVRRPMRKLTEIRRPGSKIMIYEEIGPNDPYCVNPGGNMDDWPSNRHARGGVVPMDVDVAGSAWSVDGRGNHLFFDGHVELLTPADLMAATASRPTGTYYNSHGTLER